MFIEIISAVALSFAIFITASYGIYILIKAIKVGISNWWSPFAIILGYYYVFGIPRLFMLVPNVFLKNHDIFQSVSLNINIFITSIQQILILSMSLDSLQIAFQKSVTNPHLTFLIAFGCALGCFYFIRNQLMLTICSLIFDLISFTLSLISIMALFCCRKKFSSTNLLTLKFAWIPLFLSLLFGINFGFQYFVELNRIFEYFGRSYKNLREPVNSEYIERFNIFTEIITLFGSIGMFLYFRNKGHSSESSSVVVISDQQSPLL